MLTKLFTSLMSYAIRDGMPAKDVKLTSGNIDEQVSSTQYAFDGASSYHTIRSHIINGYTVGTTMEFYSNVSASGANNWICVGSGTTPPTVDDYKLENPLLDLTYQGGVLNYQGNTLIYSGIVTNNTTAPVTINEVGVHASSSSSSSSSSGSALLIRTVLQEPITLAVGDSRTFSVAVDLDKMLETTTNG